MVDADGDNAGRNGVGGGQRGSAGMVRRRTGGHGDAGGEIAGAAKPDSGTGGGFWKVGKEALSEMGRDRRENLERCLERPSVESYDDRQGDVRGWGGR